MSTAHKSNTQSLQFTKDDSGKPAHELIPAHAEQEVAKVLAFGAAKYGPDNWRAVDDRLRYLGAARRHMNEWMRGETRDQESGLHVLAHAATSILFLLEADILELGEDTRPSVRSAPLEEALLAVHVTKLSEDLENAQEQVSILEAELFQLRGET